MVANKEQVIGLAAMKEELSALLELGVLQSVESKSDFSFPILEFEGQKDLQGLRVCCPAADEKGNSRIGSLPAALLTQTVIQAYKPSLIFSFGTAGGVEERGAKPGDIVLSSDIRFHDRRIGIPNLSYAYEKEWKHLFPVGDLAKKLGWKFDVVSTGDSFLVSDADREELKKNKAFAVEMEAAAVAYTAEVHGVPFFALKLVSNLIHSDKGAIPKEFEDSLDESAKALADALSLIFVQMRQQ